MAKHDLDGFVRGVLRELAALLGDGRELAETGSQLLRSAPHATESLSLAPSFRGLPSLLLNPSATLSFPVGDTLLARRPARPGRDPTRLVVLHNWSSIVTSPKRPPFVTLRTRMAWSVAKPQPLLQASVEEPPAACAARLAAPLRQALLPFLAHFGSLADVRRSLEAADGATLELARLSKLVEVDVALDDPAHLRALRAATTAERDRKELDAALAPFAALDPRWAM